MSNLIDYLEKVKDLPFDQEPLISWIRFVSMKLAT